MQTFETAAVISLIDHLSGPLKQLVSKVNKELGGLSDHHAPATQKMTRQQLMLAEAAEKHRRAVERIKDAYKDLALLATMHGLEKLHEKSIKALEKGKELQHRETLMAGAGMSNDEISEARARVAQGLKKAPNVSLEKGMEIWQDARSVLQDVKDVPKVIDTMLRAKGVLDHQDPTGRMSEGLGQLVKGAELLGYGSDPAKFERYINASVRAMQVMGKTIDAKQIYDIAKYEKAGGYTLDEKYQFGTAMSLAQEMKGSTFGKATDQFIKQITGGFQGNLHAAAKEFVAMGMAKKEDFELTKAGEIKGMKPGHHVMGYDLAMRNPLEWWQTIGRPHMEAFVKSHMPKDVEAERKKLLADVKKENPEDHEGHAALERATPEQLAMIAQIRKAFPNSNVSDLVTKFETQRETLERHAELYQKAKGLEIDLTKDATAAIQNFNTAMGNMGAVLTEGIMPAFAKALNPVSEYLADKAKEWGEYFKKNPDKGAAAGAAVAGGGLLAGLGGTYAMYEFGRRMLGGLELKAAAAGLTTSAALLDSAAAKLLATSKLPGVPTGPVGAAGGAGAAAAGAAGAGAAAAGAVEGAAAGAALVAEATAGATGIGTAAGTALIAVAAAGIGAVIYEGFKGFKMLWNHEHREGTPLDPQYDTKPKVSDADYATARRDAEERSRYGIAGSQAVASARQQIEELTRQAKPLIKQLEGWQATHNEKLVDSPLYRNVEAKLKGVVDEIGELENAAHRVKQYMAGVNDREGAPGKPGDTPLPPARPKDLGGVSGAPASLIAEIQKINAKPVDVNVAGDVKGEAKLSVDIKPSPLFEAKINRLEAIALRGSINNTGKNMSGPTGVTK